MGRYSTLNNGIRWSIAGYTLLSNPNSITNTEYRNGVTPFGLDVVAHQSFSESFLGTVGSFSGTEFLLPSPVAIRAAGNDEWRSMHRDIDAITAIGGSADVTYPASETLGPRAGNVDWTNGTSRLTWWGPNSRYWYQTAPRSRYESQHALDLYPGLLCYANRMPVRVFFRPQVTNLDGLDYRYDAHVDEICYHAKPGTGMHYALLDYRSRLLVPVNAFSFGPYSKEIYKKGLIIATAPAPVLGCAYVQHPTTKKSLLIVVCNHSGASPYSSNYDVAYVLEDEGWMEIASLLHVWPNNTFDNSTYTDSVFEFVYADGSYAKTVQVKDEFVARSMSIQAIWCFNKSGTQAVSIRFNGSEDTKITFDLSFTSSSVNGAFNWRSSAHNVTTTLSQSVDPNPYPGDVGPLNVSVSQSGSASYTKLGTRYLAFDYIDDDEVSLYVTLNNSISFTGTDSTEVETHPTIGTNNLSESASNSATESLVMNGVIIESISSDFSETLGANSYCTYSPLVYNASIGRNTSSSLAKSVVIQFADLRYKAIGYIKSQLNSFSASSNQSIDSEGSREIYPSIDSILDMSSSATSGGGVLNIIILVNNIEIKNDSYILDSFSGSYSNYPYGALEAFKILFPEIASGQTDYENIQYFDSRITNNMESFATGSYDSGFYFYGFSPTYMCPNKGMYREPDLFFLGMGYASASFKSVDDYVIHGLEIGGALQHYFNVPPKSQKNTPTTYHKRLRWLSDLGDLIDYNSGGSLAVLAPATLGAAEGVPLSLNIGMNYINEAIHEGFYLSGQKTFTLIKKPNHDISNTADMVSATGLPSETFDDTTHFGPVRHIR